MVSFVDVIVVYRLTLRTRANMKYFHGNGYMIFADQIKIIMFCYFSFIQFKFKLKFLNKYVCKRDMFCMFSVSIAYISEKVVNLFRQPMDQRYE